MEPGLPFPLLTLPDLVLQNMLNFLRVPQRKVGGNTLCSAGVMKSRTSGQ